MTIGRLQDHGMTDWDPMDDDVGKADIWLRLEAVMLGVLILVGMGYLLSRVFWD